MKGRFLEGLVLGWLVYLAQDVFWAWYRPEWPNLGRIIVMVLGGELGLTG